MATSLRERIERLRREIERHNYLYYVENAPVISDRRFDRLMQRLQELERANPKLITPESPTQRVGGRPIEGFRTVRHRVPMLSIENTYNERDLRRFDDRIHRRLSGEKIRYVVEQKIDGVSVSLIYENGRLVLGATRGDGLRGDDITANLRTINDIPLRLRTDSRAPKLLEVRGEVYLTNARLAQLNRVQERRGDRLFANTRNAAAGSLKLLDPRICVERGLRFLAHTEAARQRAHFTTHLEFLNLIRRLGLPVVPHSKPLGSIDDVLADEREELESRHSLARGRARRSRSARVRGSQQPRSEDHGSVDRRTSGGSDGPAPPDSGGRVRLHPGPERDEPGETVATRGRTGQTIDRTGRRRLVVDRLADPYVASIQQVDLAARQDHDRRPGRSGARRSQATLCRRSNL